MTTVVTRGAASAQALGYAARATAANYIEDVFSTYLYTGNNSTQTITNGIDLSTKGGLVWLKCRDVAHNHALIDTVRGGNNVLRSNSTTAQLNWGSDGITSFNSNGFTMFDPGGGAGRGINETGNYASWTFRKQAKFFDIVTYTGDGVNNRAISHNLGSTPGCVIVKRLNDTENWPVWHRSVSSGGAGNLFLNLTLGLSGTKIVDADATTFTVINDTPVNASGSTYVAYLFAHNAGGFGASGTDNVITCGTFTTDGSENSTTDLGYEPQWLMLKATSGSTAGSQPWRIFDSMRGLTVAGQDDASLQPNQTNAESQVNRIGITSTGFTTNAFGANTTFIYIAIRRGPMRTPTSGTSVYNAVKSTTFATDLNIGFPTDFALSKDSASGTNWGAGDRLRGSDSTLQTNLTSAELGGTSWKFDAQNVFQQFWSTGNPNTLWAFRRAPGFFDVVCYTGTGSATTFNHNLGVVPELMIFKMRSNAELWAVYHKDLGTNKYVVLNTTAAVVTSTVIPINNTAPTNSVFTLGNSIPNNTGTGTGTYVAYLFASCPGVSKVGTYTGTGTTKQIDCGFTGGARFVLIKRTDSTGDWYVWDSARGIVAGNDPYLLLNSTAAEVTNTDYIDTYSAGFEISSTAPAAINANGGTFIFLAIA